MWREQVSVQAAQQGMASVLQSPDWIIQSLLLGYRRELDQAMTMSFYVETLSGLRPCQSKVLITGFLSTSAMNLSHFQSQR